MDEEEGDNIGWIITKAAARISFDDVLYIFHLCGFMAEDGGKELGSMEGSKDGEDEDAEGDPDQDEDRQSFGTCMLSEIHGFYGRYAIISVSTVDVEQDEPRFHLYWVDTELLEVPPSLTSHAYQARLRQPTFALHI